MSEKAESKLFGGSGPVKLSSSAGSTRLSTTESASTQQVPYGSTEKIKSEEDVLVMESEQLEQPKTSGMFEQTVPSTGKTFRVTDKYFSHPKSSPLEPNISTSWSPNRVEPVVDKRSFIHPRGLVIGNVIIKSGVFVGPFAAIRGDEDEPIFIGENSAILEGAIVNSLPTRKDGQKLSQRLIRVGNNEHPIFVASSVTISQGAKIHGPAYIGNNTFIGMGSLIFWAKIGANCVIEPGALVINAEIPDGKFVPAGLSVTSQKIVQTLPVISSKYRFEKINEEMLAENAEIVNGYLAGS